MGILDRFTHRNQQPKPPEPAETIDDDLQRAAHEAVLPGFETRDDAVERVRETCDLADDDPRPAAVVGAVWAQRKAEEATWEGTSDYARLRSAFDDLEAQGMVARMNFTCCNTCGTAEIDDERTPVEGTPGYPFREEAYTFFHRQDADDLADEPSILYLTYSAWRPAADTDPALIEAARRGDRDAIAKITAYTDGQVGQRVAAALRAQGLDVVWDGDHRQRIAVRVTRWRKPLPA